MTEAEVLPWQLQMHAEPAFLLSVEPEGVDLTVAQSAWVSTKGERADEEADESRVAGLIRFLMKGRHGSPFEQVGLRFLVKTPLFVWREHYRHRIASYNEQSGRYMQLAPEFYFIAADRPIVQQGKAGAYTYVPGSEALVDHVRSVQADQSIAAYTLYEELLNAGVAKEVARMHLPLTIYSTAYVRMNLRALMNFLSLRTTSDDAQFPSFPMHEIAYLADLYEEAFAMFFPIVYEAWVMNKRVAP